ncbi:uncharacterized protein EKO05_0000018 [Ascochyta rabiei]|uniref:uncharacterized protein n=1 Tax=Didymella rabiei TaxID=5454 RepID=UPI00220690F0|nr:uncharacterized protein EKO05_0000018 [Ascochyta rabiei]UPX09327.1 hypothetical protein EKO05_0000018 [Ascochyta rabiei]
MASDYTTTRKKSNGIVGCACRVWNDLFPRRHHIEFRPRLRDGVWIQTLAIWSLLRCSTCWAFHWNISGGHLSDRIADIQTQPNGGVREPEMRLPVILVNVVTAPLALVLYGVGLKYRLHWICLTIALGLNKSISGLLLDLF